MNKKDIIESISKMTVLELSELSKEIEKKFNISNKDFSFSSNVEQKKEKTSNDLEKKTEFNVILKEIGSNKINVIKTVRSITGLGLKEAKNLVDSCPKTIKESIIKSEAENIKKIMEKSGAKVEIS